MSYASEVKKELTGLQVHLDNAKAELMALIRMNGSLGIANRNMILNVQTESPAIARRIYSLLKQFYQVESEIVVRRKMKLKKNNQYVVRLRYHAQEILSDLGNDHVGLIDRDMVSDSQSEGSHDTDIMHGSAAHRCAFQFHRLKNSYRIDQTGTAGAPLDLF